MNKVLLLTACIGVFNLSGSCSSSRKVKPEQINSLIQEKLGPNFTQETNSKGNFSLYIQNLTETDDKIALKFIVVDVAKNTIIYENSFLPGHVKWHSDTALEVLSLPGIIEADEDLSHYKKIISIALPKQ
ncbi:MAG: hypothetical protein KF803_17125 [Cyclobacteriaceae bacterium]|nr:hypothetical protein [Cyclobacteriaceae bacterium]